MPILVNKDLWYPRINQSDTTLLCDMTNKMELYHIYAYIYHIYNM